jgi:hypothetical protein
MAYPETTAPKSGGLFSCVFITYNIIASGFYRMYKDFRHAYATHDYHPIADDEDQAFMQDYPIIGRGFDTGLEQSVFSTQRMQLQSNDDDDASTICDDEIRI